MDTYKTQDTQLRVHISYSKPIDLDELTESLSSFGRLYSSFIKRNIDTDQMIKSKLCIEKIKEGSIDLYLCENLAAGLLFFPENINTLIDFAGHIKNCIEYFCRGKGDKPSLSIQECSDFNNFFAVTAGDQNGKTEIAAIVRGSNNVFNNCSFNFSDGNSGQNNVKKEIERLKAEEPSQSLHERVFMIVEQVRRSKNKNNKNKGNKVIIRTISEKSYPVTFGDDKLKQQILLSQKNPMRFGYQVDVEVLYHRENIVAYNILKLHDKVELNET